MNPIYQSWDSYEQVLAKIEGRNPDTGKTIEVKPWTNSPNGSGMAFKGAKHNPMTDEQRKRRNERNKRYMRARREKWLKQGLTTLGKPRLNAQHCA